MRILRDTKSINTEIKENPDPAIAALLTRHLQFGAEFNPDDPADLLTSRFEKLDLMFLGFISFVLVADGLRMC